jgi:RNA polymerase sigma-70 factor (ECF subfamily)
MHALALWGREVPAVPALALRALGPAGLMLAAGLLAGHNGGAIHPAPTGAPLMQSAGAQQAEEADLVRRSLGGDPAAFQALTIRYYRPVSAFLFKRIGRTDVVEDLAQDTFLQVFHALREGTRPRHFSSWLFGIAHNVAGKWLRRKRPRLFDPHSAPETAAPPSEQELLEEIEEQQRRLAALEAELASLPQESRQVLEQKHKHGRTCEQIAQALGRPVGTIKSLLSRAYKTLRDRLGPAGEDDR